ncbi:hypothetical protein D1007_48662 [Hordeum vulgare]|nr:hypothetical protein D1007_48662 [Hordeum vulgare]
MVADLDASLKWPHDNYVQGEMELERRTLEEIVERRHDHEEGGVIFISDSDKEDTASTLPIHSGNPGQGCSKDGGDSPSKRDDNDYTDFYKLLGMNWARGDDVVSF